MADVHFRLPYGLMSLHMYFGVPESEGKGAQRGDLREIALKAQVWSQYWASWMP